MQQNNKSAAGGGVEHALTSAVLGSLASMLLALTLWLCGRGFDFSDEGLYLIWISQPWTYDTSFSQFGYIYWPLYELVGGSISALRRINVLIVLGLAAAPLWLVIRRICPQTPSWQIAALVLSLAAVSLARAHLWLPTPSYNSLNLQGILLSALALVLICTPTTRREETLGAVLLGVAGWMCWAAKPTTAAVLALLALTLIVLLAPNRARTAAIAAGVAAILCLGLALALDGTSFSTHYERYARALHFSAILGASYNWAGYVVNSGIYWAAAVRDIFWSLAVLTGLVAWIAVPSSSLFATVVRIGASVAASVLIFVVIVDTSVVSLRYLDYRGLWIGAVATGVAVATSARYWRKILAPESRAQISLAAVLALLPLAYSFGTSGNLWVSAADAYAVWIIAAVVYITAIVPAAVAKNALLLLASGTLAMAAVLFAVGTERPYRQPQALRLQNITTEVGLRGATLDLDEASADYIKALRTAAFDHGFTGTTQVIDLTGRHPGTVFALGGQAPGTAWLISGYPGSATLATANLDRVACAQLAAAWLLVTPDGEMRLPDGLLNRYAIDPAQHFDELARVVAPTGFGTHILFKPRRNSADAAAACERARSAAP